MRRSFSLHPCRRRRDQVRASSLDQSARERRGILPPHVPSHTAECHRAHERGLVSSCRNRQEPASIPRDTPRTSSQVPRPPLMPLKPSRFLNLFSLSYDLRKYLLQHLLRRLQELHIAAVVHPHRSHETEHARGLRHPIAHNHGGHLIPKWILPADKDARLVSQKFRKFNQCILKLINVQREHLQKRQILKLRLLEKIGEAGIVHATRTEREHDGFSRKRDEFARQVFQSILRSRFFSASSFELAPRRRLGLRVEEAVQVRMIPGLRRDAAGGNMRLANVAVLLERRHIVANRRRRNIQIKVVYH